VWEARTRLENSHGAGNTKNLERAHDLVALDVALDELATVDPRKALVIDLRFFGGLSVEETAVALRVSVDTVMRDWKFARCGF